MIKNYEGFSLAEILITLGIISVIATACFSIANQGIDRAYSMYVYTGYEGISNAIADANGNGYNLEFNNVKDCDFSTHIYKILDGKNDSGDTTKKEFDTPCGISYKLETLGQTTTNPVSSHYVITMKVPTRIKDTNQTKDIVCLSYMPDEKYGILIPFDKISNKCEATITGLQQNRKDLLPFYVDDMSGNSSPTYTSFKDAICSIKDFSGDIDTNDGNAPINLLSCSSPGNKSGIIRSANPRKVW